MHLLRGRGEHCGEPGPSPLLLRAAQAPIIMPVSSPLVKQSLARHAEIKMVRCLEPMTTAIAGPRMVDVALTDVLRLIGRNKTVTAPNALSSIRRVIVGCDDGHVTSPFSFFLA